MVLGYFAYQLVPGILDFPIIVRMGVFNPTESARCERRNVIFLTVPMLWSKRVPNKQKHALFARRNVGFLRMPMVLVITGPPKPKI